MNGGFGAAIDGVDMHSIRTAAELNPIEDMGGRDLVPLDDTSVGEAGNRIRDERDPELGSRRCAGWKLQIRCSGAYNAHSGTRSKF